MFEDVVDRLLGDHVTPDLVRAAEAGVWPAALWRLIEETGLTWAAVPEALGGAGADWSDCFAIAVAAGRHAVPLPLVETLAVNAILGQAGAPPPAGAASLGLAVDGAIAAQRFSGVVDGVPWGRNVGHVLVGATGQLLLLATADAEIAAAANVAGEPRDRLHFRAAPILRAMPAPAAALRAAGATLRAAQIAGALAQLRTICVQYAGDRVQFGRPLAKFQAIQHQIAVLAEQAAIARSAAEAAFHRGAPAGSDRFGSAVAKQVASEAAGEGAGIAHAIFGAIGFTEEHALHLLTRRLWSWRSEFGSARFWAEAIGRGVCAAGPAAFWPGLVAGDVAIEAE